MSQPRRSSKALRLALAASLAVVAVPALAIFQNGGFELGTFASWTLGGGVNPGLNPIAPPFTGANVVITPGSPGPASVVGSLSDPRAPDLVLPRVGTKTAKINDENSGALVTTLKQVDTVTNADIDSSDGLPHIRFSFAPVLEDPGHSPHEQPYFYVVLKNTTTNAVLFEQFAYSGQPGVTYKAAGSWKYLDFQTVDVSLPMSAIGQQIELTVIAADCSLGGHGGYVYVDGFGSANVPPPAGLFEPRLVPTMGTGMLALLGVLLGLVAWRGRKQMA